MEDKNGSLENGKIKINKLEASNQQLNASNQQLRATEQQLRAANQQLKASEEKMKASNQQLMELKQAVEAAVDGIAVTALNGSITFINNSWARMHGFSVEQLLGKNMSIFHTKEQFLSDVQPHLEQMMKKGAHAGEVGHVRQDGTVFPTFMSTSLLKDNTQKPIRMIGVARDISEQKQAEERFKSFVGSATDYCLIWDKDLNLLDMNKACFDAMSRGFAPGTRKEDLIGKHIDRVIFDVKETGRYEEYVKVLETGTPFYAEDKVVNEKFGNLHMNIKAFKVGTGLGMITTNITNLKQAEESAKAANQQLRATEQQLRAGNQQLKAGEEKLKQSNKELRRLTSIMENTNDFVGFADPEGRVLFINEAGRKMCKLGLKEDLSKYKISDVHPDWVNKILFEEAMPFIIRNKIWTGEVAVITTDKKEIPVSMVFMCHKSSDGKVEYFSTILRDITEQKAAEQQLKASNQQLRATEQQLKAYNQQLKASEEKIKASNLQLTELKQAIEVAVDGIAVTDIEGKVIFVNQAWGKMHGYGAQELYGKHISMFHSPEQLKTDVEPFLKKQMENGKYADEVGHQRKDGTVFPTYMSTAVLYDENKKPVRMIGVARDITEQKRTEELMKSSEERFRAIFDNANDGIVLVDVDTKRFDTGNSTICKMLGYSLEELKTFGVPDVHPKQDLPYVFSQFEKQTRREIDVAKDLPVQRKDGTVFYADINTSPVTLNGKKYLIGIFRDTTERRQTEGKLLELKQAVEQAVDGITVTDLGGNIIFSNRAWAKMHGYTPEELAGKHISMFHTQEQLRAEVQPFLEKQMKEGSNAGEVGHLRKDGTIFPTFMSTATLYNDDKQPVRMVGVARDITAQKEAEEKIKAANQQLTASNQQLMAANQQLRATDQIKAINQQLRAAQQHMKETMNNLARSNKELEQFAYVASHDLQEPLRMVASYVQLLEKRYKDKIDKDATEFIKYASEGAKRMQSLIEDLLAYSRVSTKAKAFTFVSSDGVLKKALKNLEVAIKDSKAAITYSNLPEIAGDEAQIVQLFQNLIGNALKFQKKDTAAKIDISCKKQGTDWVFSIEDNGLGIEKQYFEKIFQIFQRLHVRGEYSGTGIGLAVCKKIVERHKGRIWIESELDKGSIFRFTIPVVEKIKWEEENV